MVADEENIVNLGAFRKISRDERKKRGKTEKEKHAAANRVKFGRSGVEKKQSRKLRDLRQRQHEGHRLDNKTPETDP